MKVPKQTGKPTIRVLRDVTLWALPGLTVVTAVMYRVFPSIKLLDWAFMIALSGTVGIWTNYFAIKMLFRPKRRTLFGIQGLIPANRKQLAEAIGQAVAEELLAPDQVFGFIEKNDIIRRLGSEGLKLAHQEIDKPERRAWLKMKVGTLLQKATAESIEDLLTFAIAKLKEIAGERITFRKLWPSFRKELESQLTSGPVHDAIGRVAVKLAYRYSPAAAEWINDQIDEYIETRSWPVRQALKLGKWTFSLNEEKIRGYIIDKVMDPDFGPSVLCALESIAPEASKLMENPDFRRAASQYCERQKLALVHWLETEGLAHGKKLILETMDTEKFWDAIERQVDRGIPSLVAWAKEQFESGRFRTQATPFLRKLAAFIPVAEIVEDRVDKFDLDELESLIYRVTSENLAGIEFLGGVLGCIAGLVLINPLFGIAIAVAGGILWLLGREKGAARAR